MLRFFHFQLLSIYTNLENDIIYIFNSLNKLFLYIGKHPERKKQTFFFTKINRNKLFIKIFRMHMYIGASAIHKKGLQTQFKTLYNNFLQNVGYIIIC